MKHFKLLMAFAFMALLNINPAWGADVTQTYTLSTSDNGNTKTTGDVVWSIAASAIEASSSNTKLVGTITITLPAGATLQSVKLTKSNTWGSGATVVFASGSTTLNTFSTDASFDLTKNKTDLVYTFTKSGNSSKNAWVKTISVTYTPGSTKTTLSFESNGGSECASTESSPATLPTPTKTGYDFAGWCENENLSDVTPKAGGSSYAFSTTKKLYAKWTAKIYTITLDANGHGDANGSATATYDATTLSDVSGVTANTGYVLNGYFTATSDGTKVINADGTLVSNVSGYTDATGKWNKDGACALYAQYTQQFTITFIDKLQNTIGYTSETPHTVNVNDGETFEFPAALSDKVVTADEKANGTCEQQHYHFVGWILSTEESTANNDGHANVKEAGSTSSAVSAAATYFAVWAREE